MKLHFLNSLSYNKFGPLVPDSGFPYINQSYFIILEISNTIMYFFHFITTLVHHNNISFLMHYQFPYKRTYTFKIYLKRIHSQTRSLSKRYLESFSPYVLPAFVVFYCIKHSYSAFLFIDKISLSIIPSTQVLLV